jgi:hypothetical protein
LPFFPPSLGLFPQQSFYSSFHLPFFSIFHYSLLFLTSFLT